MSYAKSPIFSGGYGQPNNPYKPVIKREVSKHVEVVGIKEIDGVLIPIKNVVTKTKVISYDIVKKGRIDPTDHIARRKRGGSLMYDKTKTFVNSHITDGKVKKKIQKRFATGIA